MPVGSWKLVKTMLVLVAGSDGTCSMLAAAAPKDSGSSGFLRLLVDWMF